MDLILAQRYQWPDSSYKIKTKFSLFFKERQTSAKSTLFSTTRDHFFSSIICMSLSLCKSQMLKTVLNQRLTKSNQDKIPQICLITTKITKTPVTNSPHLSPPPFITKFATIQHRSARFKI